MRDRGDACPGALRLHAADDGHLARLRVPGGLLTAAQATAVARAAEEWGDGHLDLTSRGNLQLRGLPADAGGRLADLLARTGLLPSAAHERVRNIVASPLAGLDGRGHGDLRPALRQLDRLLCAEGAAAALSGRFLFALDDGRGDVARLGADITLSAESPEHTALRVAGVGPRPVGALRLAAADGPRAALRVALGFLDAARASDERAWRTAELGETAGWTADHVRRLLGAAGIPVEVAPPVTGPPPPDLHGPPLGLVGDPATGCATLSVLVPLGRAGAGAWRTLAALAARSGAGELRVTPWRGVVLPGLAASSARAALQTASAAGFVASASSTWSGVGACAGRPGCAKALADVRADLTAVLTDPPPEPGAPGVPGADALRQRVAAARGSGGERLPVYWSGCARRCGRPRGDHVDVLALGGADTPLTGRYGVAVRGDGGAADATAAAGDND